MKLRCAFNLHRWIGEKGTWFVTIRSLDGLGEGNMGLETCFDCNALRYTTVAVTYRG